MFIVLLAWMATACSQSNFSGTQAKPQPQTPPVPVDAPATPEDPPPAPAPVATPTKCEVKDGFLKMDVPPDSDIGKCKAQGKMWNFATNTCVTALTAFDCTFTNWSSKIRGIGLDPMRKMAEFKEVAEGTAIAIGCGVRDGGNTIASQWWISRGGINPETCQPEGDVILLSTCHKREFVTSGTAPAAPKTAEEEAAEVAKCLQ